MENLKLYLAIFTLIIFISCDKQETSTSIVDCDKLTSREEAESLMNEVRNDRFTDSLVIVENLIGEWQLIGVLPGWVGFEAGQECITLNINTNTIELKDNNSGSTSSTNWELLSFEVNGYSGFYLNTNEDVWNNRIGMDIFSGDIMHGAGRVDDGNTYIYEKLN